MSLSTDTENTPSIITQVAQGAGVDDDFSQWQREIMNETIQINARGAVVELTRHELARLPQCILVGISSSMVSGTINSLMSPDQEEPVYINFPPKFLQYTIDVFRAMSYESPRDSLATFEMADLPEAIRTKPAVIVLREDVDFYCLPPARTTTKREMNRIKRACGKLLVKNNKVLTGLRKSDLPGSPEQHLIEMLCSTGFSMDETWGYREMEPNKTVVSSLALVRLRTDLLPEETQEQQEQQISPVHNDDTDEDDDDDDDNQAPPSIDQIENTRQRSVVSESDTTLADSSKKEPTTAAASISASSTTAASLASPAPHDDDEDDTTQPSAAAAAAPRPPPPPPPQQPAVDLAKSQKLFLFWKKPARKCWWDTQTFEGVEGCDAPIKVHLRSVWTLELCVID